MTAALPTDPSSDAEPALARLDAARRTYMEDAGNALAEATDCLEIGRALGDQRLCARARALQAAAELQRGDLPGALELVVDAERHCERSDDVVARCEIAAVKSQVAFLTGAYAEALRQADRAVAIADGAGALALRIHARRTTCVVFGNLGVPDLRERIEQLLALTIEAGGRWEEAISRNDLATWMQEQGDLAGAERELERALALVGGAAGNTDGGGAGARGEVGESRFALALVHATRAENRILAGRLEDALADAELSLELLTATELPNPYLLAATVRAAVQARVGLGQLDDAQRSGEGALEWLGERLPQTRSLILSTLATALREADRVDEAFDALQRSAELERQAVRELSELQRRLERATLEAEAARRESDQLAQSNRRLAEAHAELARRADQLEELHGQLREQADRDPLTGLHNRRYLARELNRLATDRLALPLSLAVLDLDYFKSVNDRFGHAVGDQVLIRAAALLCDALRGADTVVRSGGEEFVLVMPATGERAAAACCERIRAAVRGADWEQVAPGLALTTSVGLATTQDQHDLETALRIADQRLYCAKRSGRDRVVDASNAQVD